MTDFEHISPDDVAERATRVISHLDGALDATMLDAMQGVWSTLEHASVNGEAHARAVRARLFWQSIAPTDAAAAAAHVPVSELAADQMLAPAWMHDDDEGELSNLADAA